MKLRNKHMMWVMGLLFSIQSHSATISINVDQDTVSVGEEIFVTITGSGFSSAEDFDLFNFDIGLDNSIFGFNSTSLQSDLIVFDPLLFAGLSVLQTPSSLSFAFVDLFPFAASQGEFTLASFTLSALQVGVSENFTYSADDFAQGFFAPFSFTPINFSAVTNARSLAVVVQNVSAPPLSVLILFTCVLIACFNLQNTRPSAKSLE